MRRKKDKKKGKKKEKEREKRRTNFKSIIYVLVSVTIGTCYLLILLW